MNVLMNASEAIGDRDGVIRVSTEHIAVGQAEAIVMAVPAGDVMIILTGAYSEEEVTSMMRKPAVRGFIRKPLKVGISYRLYVAFCNGKMLTGVAKRARRRSIRSDLGRLRCEST